MPKQAIDHKLRDIYLELKSVIEPHWRHDDQMMAIAEYIKENYKRK